jgi:hypothetical protein
MDGYDRTLIDASLVRRLVDGQFPACDIVIAWTFLDGPSRDRFRAERGVDAGTWARGRGWALWKALITNARRDIERILADRG